MNVSNLIKQMRTAGISDVLILKILSELNVSQQTTSGDVAQAIADAATALSAANAATLDAATALAATDLLTDIQSPLGGLGITNFYYDTSLLAFSTAPNPSVANKLTLTPFLSSRDLSISQLGVVLTSALVGGEMKMAIYEHDLATGLPKALLHQQGVGTSTNTTGYVNEVLSFNFEKSKIYWLGVRFSGVQNYREIKPEASRSFGYLNASDANPRNVIQQSLAFANPCPDPIVINEATDLLANAYAPSIRFRLDP